MIKKIVLAIVVLVVGIIGYASFQPAEYLIYRDVAISAPAEKIFPFLNSSKAMNEWMPWVEVDPKMKMTYEGPDSGVGAKSSWQSEGQMGVGSATIVESVPNQKVVTRLEYEKPFKGIQTSELVITGSGNQSLVRWSVQGKNNLVGRVMCLFMNMDKMVGGSFEKGLKQLKSNVEKL